MTQGGQWWGEREPHDNQTGAPGQQPGNSPAGYPRPDYQQPEHTRHQQAPYQQPRQPDQGFGQPGHGYGQYPTAPGGLSGDPTSNWTSPGYFSPQPEQQPPPPARPRRARLGGIGIALLSLLLGLVGGVAGSQLMPESRDTTVPVASGGSTIRPPDSVAGVAAKVLPSTVSIEVRAGDQSGSGSGFVLRSDGLILTNNHVVDGADDGGIRVVFPDGSMEDAKVVGKTVAYDLAVLSVPRQGLTALPLGDSDAVVVGDPVIAIGAPLGLQSTVTTGIVSALHRPVVAGENGETFISAIQTDAAINPGNSGGPLVNDAGKVIGINTAIARSPGSDSQTGGNIGLGFAIPSKQAARTAEQLIATGKATYPLIGVLLDQSYTGEGVRVASDPGSNGQQPVDPSGPAGKAGIKPGEIIVGFQGRPVTAPDELIVGIRAQRPGDTVTLAVKDGTGQRDVTITLSESESS